jgi:hypothetical protein
MVSHEREFRSYTKDLASSERYVTFLHDITEESGLDITPQTLRSDEDIETFASRLSGRFAAKSIDNYRSVMRKYVAMVQDRAL